MVDVILRNLRTILQGCKVIPQINKSINDGTKLTCNKTLLYIRYFSFDFLYLSEQEKIFLCMEHCISCGILLRNDNFSQILAENCFPIKYKRRFNLFSNTYYSK